MTHAPVPSLTDPNEQAQAPADAAVPAASMDRELTTADRCDLCGAQAFIRVVMSSGELLFCGHHGREHGDALRAKALFIQDETAHILTA